jgi:hypothetical protein
LLALGLVAVVAAVHALDACPPLWPLPWPVPPAAAPHLTGVPPPAEGHTGGDEIVPEAARPLRIALIASESDHLRGLLDSLGPGYQYEEMPIEHLRQAAALAEYDVVFFPSGDVPDAWRAPALAADGRTSPAEPTRGSDASQEVSANLRQFVASGGTLYASDRRFDMLADAFPEYIDKHALAIGKSEELDAEILAPDLRRAVGLTIGLHLPADCWRTAAFGGERCEVLVKGKLEKTAGETWEVPVLVRFRHEKGTVIFASFYPGKQNSVPETELFRCVVFQAVTAGTASRIAERLSGAAATPQGAGIFSISASQSQIARFLAIESGPLRFVLAFRSDRPTRLRLDVEGPRGQRFQKEGSAPFEVVVPEGEIGPWQCTITGVTVPYDNFVCTLTMAGTPGAARTPPR